MNSAVETNAAQTIRFTLPIKNPHGDLSLRLRPVEAFASLLSSCSTMLWDKSSYNAICSTVERVVGLVPAYHLQCLPNREAAELSHRYLCAENNV